MKIQVDMMVSIVLLAGSVFFVIAAILAFFYNVKLSSYLKKNKLERWEHLSTIGSLGPGLSNPFRWIPYLYGNDDVEDITIRYLKGKVRFFIILMMLSLCIFLAISLTVAIAI